MRLFYKQLIKNEIQQFLLTGIDHIEVHPKFIYYWYKDDPSHIFMLNLTDITNVRIYE